jgi:DNA-directed RNA polymerase specialized sigma24 family protein
VTIASAARTPDPSGEPVRAAINALRPADREALQLVLWDGLSHSEAGAVPPKTSGRYRATCSA